MQLEYDDNTLYIIKTTDERTKKTEKIYFGNNKKEARNEFRRLINHPNSLKTWLDIQKDPKKYTEITLSEIRIREFPIWNGFIETKLLNKTKA